MKNKFKISILFYLIILFIFSVFYLNLKHNVLNDSTISEWLINYYGGFTKRGIIGQISIFFSNLFNISLRDSILIFQILIIAVYYLLSFSFLKNLKYDRIILLSIFTPIFLLYPVAEIEVLARKEIFLFIIFISYLMIPLKNKKLQTSFKFLCFPLSILIWEPIIFLFLFWIALDVIYDEINFFDTKFLKKIVIYLPGVFIAFYIATNPLDSEQHLKMASYLKSQFGETCYMSCARLKTTATILQNFQHNIPKYSIEVFFRYFLIILIGFGPLFILLFFSSFKNKNLLVFKKFQNLLFPFLIILSPTIVLFAMGGDWGRWVNIIYTFSFLTYFTLYKKKLIVLNTDKLKNNILNKIKKKTFIFVFIIFSFGWNPKTVITGDVASIPGYRIPYKTAKILLN